MATKAESTVTESNDQHASETVAPVPNTQADAAAAESTNVTGRAVFSVETTAAGVVVRTAFLTEENKLLNMPAVFPDLVYAINVIDDLKRQVMQHFSQAAQVGAQVISNQARAQQEQQSSQQQTISAPSDAEQDQSSESAKQ